MKTIFEAAQQPAREELNNILQVTEVEQLRERIELIQQRYKNLRQEHETAQNEFKYAIAEAQNCANRKITLEKQNAMKVCEKLILDLLEPIDDLERVILYLQDKISQEELTGLTHVYKKLLSALSKSECEQVESEGEFNPDLHEAVSTEAGEEPNKITRVFQNGYKFKNKLIRPAKVVVSI